LRFCFYYFVINFTNTELIRIWNIYIGKIDPLLQASCKHFGPPKAGASFLL